MHGYSSFVFGNHVNSRHELRTPNEGTNQRYLKNWADVADKICFGRTYEFGIGIEFSAVHLRLFPFYTLIEFGDLLAKTSKMQKLTFLLNKYTKLKLRHYTKWYLTPKV